MFLRLVQGVIPRPGWDAGALPPWLSVPRMLNQCSFPVCPQISCMTCFPQIPCERKHVGLRRSEWRQHFIEEVAGRSINRTPTGSNKSVKNNNFSSRLILTWVYFPILTLCSLLPCIKFFHPCSIYSDCLSTLGFHYAAAAFDFNMSVWDASLWVERTAAFSLHHRKQGHVALKQPRAELSQNSNFKENDSFSFEYPLESLFKKWSL